MPIVRHRLEPGDRLPDFTLADQTGMLRPFYMRVEGRGTIIFVDCDETLRWALRGLEDKYRAAELDCYVIADTAEGADPWPCSLADNTGQVRQAIRDMSGHRLGPAAMRPLAILLDRNQRVLALADEGDLAQWALARWSAEPPSTPVAEIRHVAPVLTIPNLLSRADCSTLIARWHAMGHEEGSVSSMVKGEVVTRVYEDLKKRRDHRLEDPAIRKPLMAIIARRLGPELNKAFFFGGSVRFDRVLIACYDAGRGDYFRRHRDNQTPNTADRRFALTVNLNSDEYDGGELIFPEFGDYRYKPDTGAAVVFSCSLLHEALPVTRGQRFALLTFICDVAEPANKR
ncbi:MAG: 2OG-Fe(II) oxygenase [Dongiaceae bacterium]